MSYNKKIDYVFVAFPSFLAETDELTPQDKAVFLYFVSCSYRNWNPSYRELARKLSLGNTTIRKSIIKLHLLGFITARTSIRGEAVVNEINSYVVNLAKPELWCPTLDLKEDIERCFELNGKACPTFRFVYMDRKALAEDMATSLKKGHIVRREAVTPENAQRHFTNELPLKVLMEFEESLIQAKRVSIWQACIDFSLWLQRKSNDLTGDQSQRFKQLFINEVITSDKWLLIKEGLLSKSHQEFLVIVSEEKEKSRLARERKKNDEVKSI